MSNGLLFLSLSFCKNNRGETMMCSLCLSLSLSFCGAFLTLSFSLSHRSPQKKERDFKESRTEKRSDEFPIRGFPTTTKKRYEKPEILKRGELAKTRTPLDVFDWILSRRVFDVSSRERGEAKPVESGRLENGIER